MAILVDCNPDANDRFPYVMTSDESLDELVRFASRMGLKREWLEDVDGAPHFRINHLKRKEAIVKGARATSMREIFSAAWKIRKHVAA